MRSSVVVAIFIDVGSGVFITSNFAAFKWACCVSNAESGSNDGSVIFPASSVSIVPVDEEGVI